MHLKTQPNENRCKRTLERHILSVPKCCPMSGNPLPGSKIVIEYEPGKRLLEVQALRAYIDSYIGGRGDIRSMEGMIQNIAQDVADVLGVRAYIKAFLEIAPEQQMELECSAYPGI